MGVYDYMLRNFNPGEDRDIVFIPVGINYDRAVEDRSLLHDLDPEAPRRSTWFVIRTTAGFIWHSLVLMVLSRWQKFGFAGVNFGNHLSARQYCQTRGINFAALERTQRFEAVAELATQLVVDIGKLMPVLPVPLVAAVMLNNRERWMSAIEVESEAERYIERLENVQRHRFTFRRKIGSKSLMYALETLTLRRFVEETDDHYRAATAMWKYLHYYANSLAHWDLDHENYDNRDIVGFSVYPLFRRTVCSSLLGPATAG